ncbi:MBL fold metallo-hydrolase [Streptomyces sp. 769]|uniref:MBL fold metallo-hydrolase n=1 Tax=Streptomyces sp. 769 TaxID=1262452 RepID=UPI00057F9C72|nr:MBL fold metallo-hydrolase [Streptomyces sp. 769]AJC53250.1 Zn-dependent hydrolase of the beta-lactamase fold-like protein [Streptomyces sp. 769]
MKITKFGHACVRLEKNGRAVVIDPGVMTPEPDASAGAEAVFITHQHFDHFDPERLRGSRAPVYTCAGVAEQLGEFGERVHVVRGGDHFSVAGFEVSVAGDRHHHSHPDAPPVDNVGFLVDGEVFHPGDALTVVDTPTLLLPGQAPWLTVPAMIEYLRRMAPRRAYAIHDGLLNEWGLKVLDDVLAREAGRTGADVRRLRPGESVEL